MNVARVAKLSGYVNVTPSDLNAFKLALTERGPLSVAIDASHLSFSFYSSGVYYEPECRSGLDGIVLLLLPCSLTLCFCSLLSSIRNLAAVADLDHAVLAVGYGTLNGEPYTLVKNSWSTWWGNDGYVLMSQRDNNCGVLTNPTYPTIV